MKKKEGKEKRLSKTEYLSEEDLSKMSLEEIEESTRRMEERYRRDGIRLEFLETLIDLAEKQYGIRILDGPSKWGAKKQ